MGENVPEIPKFDLADEIMAQQRRITAVRRKGPLQTPAGGTTAQAGLSARWQLCARPVGAGIICEIVARDIAEKSCHGPVSAAEKGS